MLNVLLHNHRKILVFQLRINERTGSHSSFIIEKKIWLNLFLLLRHMKMWCWKMFKSGICLKNFIKPFNHSFNGLWILPKIPTGMWIMICTPIYKSSRIIIYSNFKEKSSSETLQILPLFSKNKKYGFGSIFKVFFLQNLFSIHWSHLWFNLCWWMW